MESNYLRWVKDLEIALEARWQSIHSLLSSAVSEPRELLERDFREFQESGLWQYRHRASSWGHPLLKERIAARYGLEEKRIATTNGVSNGIYLLCNALLESDSHVLVESPTYQPLVMDPEHVGATVSHISRKPPRYALDIEEILPAVRSDTRMIILCNLHNPSGVAIDDGTLRELVERCLRVNPKTVIVVDEVYHDFIMTDQRPAAVLDDAIVSLNSLTKVYGLGCLHCGWLMARPGIIEKVLDVQMHVEGSYPRLPEDFNTFVFGHIDEYWRRAIDIVSRNRKRVNSIVSPLVSSGRFDSVPPQQGCIYFPRIEGVSDTGELTQKLAASYDVYVVPGKFFGQPDGIRIGFGGDEGRCETALTRLVEALGDLLDWYVG